MRKYTSLPFTEYTTASGNFDANRKPITKIVLHSIVGTVNSAISRFATRNTGVSAHYIIGNDGKLYAGLEEYFVAYHSGSYGVNQESIGIEHEWYQGLILTDKLYETSSKLVADICRAYGIPCDAQHVLRHNQIVATGCPNLVDTNKIIALAQKVLQPQPLTCEQKLDKTKQVLLKQGITDTQRVQEAKKVLGIA